jgi:hypothetical protein
MPENKATENRLSSIPGNIFNTDESDIQANNKPDSVITEKGSKIVHVLTSGEKSENITATKCCNAADQFLPLVLIFKDIYKKQEIGDGLLPGSEVYRNQDLYPSTDLFIKRFTECFLKHKSQGR